MDEIVLLLVLLFAAYLFLPSAWLPGFGFKDKPKLAAASSGRTVPIPEDSVLRRHFITQLRAEIELELSPRPTDFTLQRHHDALVAAKLENRLATLTA